MVIKLNQSIIMYSGGGSNTYGYGRSALPTSSKNNQNIKYTTPGQSASYGVNGAAGSSSLGSNGTRTRDTGYGSGK